MLIYRRYILSNLIPTICVVTFALTTLVWVFQILKLLFLLEKGVLLGEFIVIAILILPSLLFVILPLVTVFSVIYVYSRLYTDRQLIVLKNFGLSNLQLAYPAILLGLAVSILGYYISSTLMPASYIHLKNKLDHAKNHYISNLITNKTFIPVSKAITLYVDQKTKNNIMQGIVIFDGRNPAEKAILFAQLGRFYINQSGIPTFELLHGSRQSYDTNGKFSKLNFDAITLELPDKDSTNKKSSYNKHVNEYYISELLHPDGALSIIRQNKLIAEAHQRLIWPAYSLFMSFIALSIFLKVEYNKKSQLKHILYVSLILITLLYVHFSSLNAAGTNPYWLAICYVNILFNLIIAVI